MENENPPIEALNHTQKKVENSNRSLSEMMPIEYLDLAEMCEENPMTRKALSEMERYAAAYMTDVWDMKLLYSKKSEYEESEWADMLAKAEDDRTRLHNTYIESVAILSRAMNNADMDTTWVTELMSGGKLNRAACGNFGIMLTYSRYVNG